MNDCLNECMKDLSCTYLAHHELESESFVIMIIIIIITIIIIVIVMNERFRASRHCWRTW